MKEFRFENVDAYEVGQEIKVEDMFKEGDKVDISGISKGKGFQGTVKRYGTARSDVTWFQLPQRRWLFGRSFQSKPCFQG